MATWLYLFGAVHFIGAAIYFTFVLSRRGTALRPARAIRLRVPQLPWLFIVGNALVWIWALCRDIPPLQAMGILAVTFSLYALYWAVRFGTLRVVSFLILIAVAFLAASCTKHWLLPLWAILYGGATSLLVDELWNDRLKKTIT